MAGKVLDRGARRQAILQAAAQVFARRGYEPATLEAVAREADLAKGTLYLYFRNKEDLYFHTILSMLERLESSILEKARSSTGALDGLRAVALGQFEFFSRHQDTLQLFAPFSNPNLARLHKRLIAAMMEKWAGHIRQITTLVEEGQREGALRGDIQPRSIALAYIGMANQAAQSLIRRGPSGPPAGQQEESPEGMADTVMRILLEGVRSR